MGIESEQQKHHQQQINIDDLGQQQDDALLPRPELPPRMTATVQRSPPPYISNQNVFRVLMKNKRQITSLTAGLCGFLFSVCLLLLLLLLSHIIIIHLDFTTRVYN